MNVIYTIIMYLLWTLSIGGILLITFTNFQFFDLNILVGVILAFTVLNSFMMIKRKK